jgi:hypothetical protein
LLEDNEINLYGKFKRYITNELDVSSQVIKTRSVKNTKAFAIISKVLMQINQKIGGVAWRIVPQRFQDNNFRRNIAYGGIAISKSLKGYTLAFADTANRSFTTIFNFSKCPFDFKESFPEKVLEAMFFKWIKVYSTNTNSHPETLIVFREGFSIPQIKVQVEREIKTLNNVAKIIERQIQ